MTGMRLLASGFLLLFLVYGGRAIKCYICNNCNKYEESQSRHCPTDSSYCMKLDMITGQIQRRCATHELCSNPEENVKTKHKRVSCCDTDNCNSAPAPTTPHAQLLSATALGFAVVMLHPGL